VTQGWQPATFKS